MEIVIPTKCATANIARLNAKNKSAGAGVPIRAHARLFKSTKFWGQGQVLHLFHVATNF
jgi:hypothetical protein